MLRRALAAVPLILATACGGYEPPPSLQFQPVPQPDVCRLLDAKLVKAALKAKAEGCQAEAQQGVFGARFSKGDMALVVSYQGRYDSRTGFDQWLIHGETSETRVSMIGVGEGAVFDEKSGTMTSVSGGLLISVGLQSAARPSAKDLPERLLPVLEAALLLARTPSPQASPPGAV